MRSGSSTPETGSTVLARPRQGNGHRFDGRCRSTDRVAQAAGLRVQGRMLDRLRNAPRWLAVTFACSCAASNAAKRSPSSQPLGDHGNKTLPKRVETVAPPPNFPDPERRAKLEAAIPAIDAYLQRTVERDGLVGLAAGIVFDDALVWSRGYGLRDPARGLPVEADTAFGIGSITKPITGFAVLLLRDRGKLTLDQPAVAYLPALAGLVYPTRDSPLITIRHLLTHTSGLPRMGNFPEYPIAPQTREDLLASLDGLRLDRPPGTKRVYSNLGVQILGPLIDAVAEEDHRTFMRRELFEPIGMIGAGWTPREVGEDRLAIPHDFDEHGRPRRRPHWMPGAADAAGGLYASVEDLAAFAIYNLRAWPAGGSRDTGPLRAATVRETHTGALVRSFEARRGHDGGPPTARVLASALGFSVYSTCRYPHVVAHGGKTMGHRASLHMLPQHGVAVILLTNLSSIHSSVLPRDAEAVLDLLHDTGALQPREPSAAPGLLEGAEALGALLTHWTTPAYERAFSPDYRDAFTEQATARKLEAWRSLVGACRKASVSKATDAYTGTLELDCGAAALQLELRVAPWDDHPITSMRILGATRLEPTPPVTTAAQAATNLLERWDAAAFERLFIPSTSARRMRDFLARVSDAVGRCELGVPRFVEPNGATFVLQCERGRATMQLVVEEDGKIAGLAIRDDTTGPCR